MLVPPAVQRIYKPLMIWPSRGQGVCTADLVVLLTCSIIRRDEVKDESKQCTLPSGSGVPVAWEAGMRTWYVTKN